MLGGNILKTTQLFTPIAFHCHKKTGKKSEKWDGVVTRLIHYQSHYEILIQSRSSIMVTFGTTSHGTFACIPDFGVGCHLADLRDKFWNTEKLSQVLGKVDGITVAQALYALADSGMVS